VETRDCLVSLVDYTPASRLILVDNCSDRETERMLEEFAEALDVRVLLLRTPVNEGFVKAVNRGLSRAETPLVALVRHNSLVTPNWIEPLLSFAEDEPSCGIIVPAFTATGSRRQTGRENGRARGVELHSADFAAVLLRRSLLAQIGAFDEHLDGGSWCLKEFSRRAYRAGFTTSAVPEGVVRRTEDVRFGSVSRREELEKSIRERFIAQWGVERSFCLYLPKEADADAFIAAFPVILAAARQGNRITILAHARPARRLFDLGLQLSHRHVEIVALPLLMPARTVRQVLEAHPEPPILVEVQHGTPCPGFVATIDFDRFVGMISAAELEFYGRRLDSSPPPA